MVWWAIRISVMYLLGRLVTYAKRGFVFRPKGYGEMPQLTYLVSSLFDTRFGIQWRFETKRETDLEYELG